MAASIPSFDEKLESWESYKERLQNYFIALDIEDETKKKAILTNVIGPGNYERVRNMCFPASANDKNYEELLEMFDKLFTPSTVIFKERKMFYLTRKPKNTKATEWHETVRRLALNCKFGAYTENALLDKFVTSFDGMVFERFCEEGTDLTLSKALEIAQRYESIDTPKSHPNPPKTEKTKKPQQQQKDKPPSNNQNKQPNTEQKKKVYRGKGNVNSPVTTVEVNMHVKKN